MINWKRADRNIYGFLGEVSVAEIRVSSDDGSWTLAINLPDLIPLNEKLNRRFSTAKGAADYCEKLIGSWIDRANLQFLYSVEKTADTSIDALVPENADVF